MKKIKQILSEIKAILAMFGSPVKWVVINVEVDENVTPSESNCKTAKRKRKRKKR